MQYRSGNLRQGRKYGLGGCIATQRISYLKTCIAATTYIFYGDIAKTL
jgi:hypothetical protein